MIGQRSMGSRCFACAKIKQKGNNVHYVGLFLLKLISLGLKIKENELKFFVIFCCKFGAMSWINLYDLFAYIMHDT